MMTMHLQTISSVCGAMVFCVAEPRNTPMHSLDQISLNQKGSEIGQQAASHVREARGGLRAGAP